MRIGAAAAWAIGVVVWAVALPARAEAPRDYFLNAPRPGNYAHLDAYTVGTQLSLENRSDLEPGMSMLTTRASGILSYPYADGSINMDARVFLFTLGGSLGYRWVYRNLRFSSGESRTFQARLDREKAGQFDTQGFAYGEGRFQLVVPLDFLFLINKTAVRWEGRQDNSFDWLYATVHDRGTMVKNETTLFYRHRDFGAIGPMLRVMDLPKDGTRKTELHVGLVYGTRPGLVSPRHHNSDLFLLQVLGKPGDNTYGLHGYHVPLYILAVYRATLSLD
jgi:hypothetical protein